MIDLKCKICNINYETKAKFSQHLRRAHSTTIKNYIDLYFTNQNRCPTCGKITNWKEWIGEYAKFCSIKCSTLDIHNRTKINKGYQLKKDKFLQDRKTIWLTKYGTDNPTKNPFIRNKGKETCRQRYGVDNPMHNKDIFYKTQKSLRRYKEYVLPSGRIIKIQGYEPQFLDYFLKNNILCEDDIEYRPPPIKYIDLMGNNRMYYPDFYIKKYNLIIEIKSKYTLNLNNDNISKAEYTRKAGFIHMFIIDHKFDDVIAYIKNYKG